MFMFMHNIQDLHVHVTEKEMMAVFEMVWCVCNKVRKNTGLLNKTSFGRAHPYLQNYQNKIVRLPLP